MNAMALLFAVWDGGNGLW